MTTQDLINRLRDTASKGVSVWGDLQMEAAKEIETLLAERECYASAMDRMQAALAEPSEPIVKWATAPIRTEWGAGLMEGLVEIDRDHTLRLFAEAEMVQRVEQLIRSKT